MKSFRFLCALIMLGLALTIPTPESLMSATGAFSHSAQDAGASAAEPTRATIIRTIVYNQITNLSSNNIEQIKMSADGSRIVFTRIIAGGDAELYTLKTDGTEQPRRILANGARLGYVDISADGNKIILAVPGGNSVYSFFTANFDGSNQSRFTPALPNAPSGTTGPRLPLRPRLTADGSRIYFTNIYGGPDSAGVWRVNFNGSEPTRIFSVRQVAAFFNREVPDPGLVFTGNFDISDDGARLVFACSAFSGTVGSIRLGETVSFDGAFHRYPALPAGRRDNQDHALSGDGSRLALFVQPYNSASNTFGNNVLLSLNFDGSGTVVNVGDAGPGFGGRLQMTRDGAKVLVGESALGFALLNTDGSGRFDLIASPCLGIGLTTGQRNPFYRAAIGITFSLTADGRRFNFASDPLANGAQQIWVGDINPASTNPAPAISEVTFDPNFVLTRGTSASTFSARVTGGTGAIQRVCNDALKEGAYYGDAGLQAQLFDNGTNGDPTVGDSVYTNNNERSSLKEVPASPLEIRFAAATDRQVTVVDTAPFFILDQAPPDVSPQIAGITPNSGQPGTQITITGTNFNPTPGNNVVLIGNRQAFVVSATATQIVVIVPPDLPPGQMQVTVSSGGRTSNAVPFTVTGGAGGGVTLTDHRVTAGPIPGGCEPPTAKTNFVPTDVAVIQWTYVSGARMGDAIRWEFVQPNGSIYEQFQYSLVNSGQVCFWSYDGMRIARQPAASLPGNWQVRVFFNGTLLVTDNFTITAASACPTISIINPTNGAVGTVVTIAGTNFTGVTAVKFSNNVSAQFTVNSDTQITTTVPSGAVTGPITISKPDCPDAQTGAFTATTSARWFVWLYNIDDVGTVSVNGRQVLQATFGQDVGMEITSFLQPGSNTVIFTLDNNVGGYSYGFAVYRDGALYFSEQCGIFNTFGCNAGDQTLGRVIMRTITIRL